MKVLWLLFASPLILALNVALAPHASAEGCDSSGSAGGQYFGIAVDCSEPGSTTPMGPTPGSPSVSPFIDYRWASMCAVDPMTSPGSLDCAASMTCDQPKLRRWQLWGQLPNKSWRVIRSQCFGGTPPAYQPPKVTPAMVLSALRRVRLPQPTTHVQPKTKTLVNFDTIFYTDPQPVNLTLTILRQAVQVEARPTTYHWIFGDGDSAISGTPGAPYPSKEIVHRYLDADVTVSPHVEAVYSARFRVGGGAWQEIGETVTSAGPPTDLRVVEGTPLLSGGHR